MIIKLLYTNEAAGGENYNTIKIARLPVSILWSYFHQAYPNPI